MISPNCSRILRTVAATRRRIAEGSSSFSILPMVASMVAVVEVSVSAQQPLLAARHRIDGRGRYPCQGGDIVHFGRKITALAEQLTCRLHDRLPRCLRILLAAAHSDGRPLAISHCVWDNQNRSGIITPEPIALWETNPTRSG